jgi:hypothetical protein
VAFRRHALSCCIALVVVLGITSDAWAWGPATHVKLASDVLSHLELLPAAIATLIYRYRRAFTYGNVATDTVFAKKMTRIKQICHHWTTGFGLLESAKTDEGRAFAYGYLSHLAADTVAHNKFLPRQIAVSRSTVTFGHLYWEIRADAVVERHQWQRLRNVLRDHYPEPEGMLREFLVDTLLSFRANRLLFKRMNLLASERAWRRSVDFWAQISRFQLDAVTLHGFQQESLSRILDVLTHGQASVVLHEDPNGNSALDYAKAQRKQLRQMKRARMPHLHVIDEAAAGHAPRIHRALTLSDGRT